MYCKICGASLAPGEVFCKNCGASNANQGPVAPTVEPGQAKAIAPLEPVQAPKPPVEPPKPSIEPMASQPPSIEPMAPQQPAMPMPPISEHIEVQEPTIEPIVEKAPEETVKEKKDSGKFLVIIGVVVGILAAAVIGYLIYSSLSSKNSGEGTSLVVTNHANYNVSYGGYVFALPSNITADVTKHLSIKKNTWNANISYSETPDYGEITGDNLKSAFETVTDYKVGEFAQKTYGNFSCLEANVDYTNGAKTLLILCKREIAGYWFIEIGTSPYTSYPTSDIASEVVTLLSSATKGEIPEGNLKIDSINIVTETPEEASNEQ